MQVRLFGIGVCLCLMAVYACSGRPSPPTSHDGNKEVCFALARMANPEIKRSLLFRACTQLGVRYNYGGASPEDGFDCSGLLFWTFREDGVLIPRTTKEIVRAGAPVSLSKLRSGDIVVFKQGTGLHTGIYLGENLFIHSPKSGTVVRLDSIDADYWKSHFYKARRIF